MGSCSGCRHCSRSGAGWTVSSDLYRCSTAPSNTIPWGAMRRAVPAAARLRRQITLARLPSKLRVCLTRVPAPAMRDCTAWGCIAGLYHRATRTATSVCRLHLDACHCGFSLLYCSTVSQGNKTSNLSIVYTPASNLRKNGEMATGQVRPPPLCMLPARLSNWPVCVGLSPWLPPSGCTWGSLRAGSLWQLRCAVRCLPASQIRPV